MGIWWILFLILGIPFLAFIAFLALSSCLGDHFRSRPRLAGFPVNPRHAAYDQTYFRTMTNHPSGMSEQIEMEDMLNERDRQGMEGEEFE